MVDTVSESVVSFHTFTKPNGTFVKKPINDVIDERQFTSNEDATSGAISTGTIPLWSELDVPSKSEYFMAVNTEVSCTQKGICRKIRQTKLEMQNRTTRKRYNFCSLVS